MWTVVTLASQNGETDTHTHTQNENRVVEDSENSMLQRSLVIGDWKYEFVNRRQTHNIKDQT